MARKSILKKTHRDPFFSGGLKLFCIALVPALALAFGFWQLVPQTSQSKQLSYEVVARYPHDPGAFTQGLLFHAGYLYESTGLYGESSLRKIEIETGRILQARELDRKYFAEGLALRGQRLYQLTWRSGRGFVYGLSDFRPQGDFRIGGEGWGLVWDGDEFILSDGTPFIRFLDPETLGERRRREVRDSDGRPVARLNELEMVEGLLFANQWQTERVAVIRPGSGRVVAWLDLSALRREALAQGGDMDVLNGLAWDPQKRLLYATGKKWPLLFALKLDAGLESLASLDK